MKPRKTLEKIRSGSRNIAFSDMVSLIQAYGFVLERVTGSHHIFGRDGIPKQLNLQPVRGQVKFYQVRQVMALVERFNLTLGDDE